MNRNRTDYIKLSNINSKPPPNQEPNQEPKPELKEGAEIIFPAKDIGEGNGTDDEKICNHLKEKYGREITGYTRLNLMRSPSSGELFRIWAPEVYKGGEETND